MNRNQFIILSCALLFVLSLAGCKQEELPMYDQTPRIDFVGGNVEEIIFRDTTYLKNIRELKADVSVSLVGAAQDNPMSFSLTLVPDPETTEQPGITLVNPYRLPAGAYTVKPSVTVTRPQEFDRPQTVFLGFEEPNGATHQFDKGRVEFARKKLSVVFRINPGVWDNRVLGLYSNGKYAFIMDTMGKVYSEIERNEATRELLYLAYVQYRQNNPPIMDDETPRREIVFPAF